MKGTTPAGLFMAIALPLLAGALVIWLAQHCVYVP